MQYYKFLLLIFLFGVGIFVLPKCGGINPDEDAAQVISHIQVSEYFSPTSVVTELTFQVEFEDGAKPYVGQSTSRGLSKVRSFPCWQIFSKNMEDLFKIRIQKGFQLNMPSDQSIQTKISFADSSKRDQPRAASEILDLGRQLKNPDTSTGRTIIILFLNGFYQGDPNILGVSFGATSIIAIFKQVIEGGGFDEKQQVEQAVLVHEAGHALGLVNNGLPMQSSHEDTVHDPAKRAHCSVDQCVMFWSVNTVSNTPDRIKKNFMPTAEVLFGQECLNDAHNYTP